MSYVHILILWNNSESEVNKTDFVEALSCKTQLRRARPFPLLEGNAEMRSTLILVGQELVLDWTHNLVHLRQCSTPEPHMYTLRATPDFNMAPRNSYAIGSPGRWQRKKAEGRERLRVRMKEGTEGGWEGEGKGEERKEGGKDGRIGGEKEETLTLWRSFQRKEPVKGRERWCSCS